VIVSDGGSADGTVELARTAGARIVVAPRGRGHQLRIGAAAAAGEVILLLHADTWMPFGGDAALIQVLAKPGVVAGAFLKRFRDGHWLMSGSRLKCRIRMSALQFAYGDQALFVRRDILEKIGGIPAVPLMEEHELCRRLRAHGRLELAAATVLTSARRFRERGVLRTYARMISIEIRWRLGASPEALASVYRS
jgi:rSAM/selenodomain-associated transferase 2